MQRPLKHVLLVAQDSHTIGVVTSTLQAFGFLVYHHARATAREFERTAFDMVILEVAPTDVHIEEGQSLSSRFPSVPIICVTGESQRTMVEKVLPEAEILVKPVDASHLARAFIY